MKKTIALILAIIIVVSTCFVACSKKETDDEVVTATQAVTNESGEEVTDENGEVVTEVVEIETVTDENGKTVTDTQGKPVTTVKSYTNSSTNNNSNSASQSSDKDDKENGKSDTTTSAPSKKPSKPADIGKLTATSTQNSVELSWKEVKCNGYEIQFSTDNQKWEYVEKEFKKTSYTMKKLDSYTTYYFRVRAYNKNKAGKSTSKNWATVEVTTKENEKINRKITLSVVLPNKGGIDEEITVYVDGKKDGVIKTNLDGSTVEYTTENKYEGLVNVKLEFAKSGLIRNVKTDKEKVEFNFSGDGIKIVEGEDD